MGWESFMRLAKLVVVAGLMTAGAGGAWAAGSPVPFDYRPDPALKTESVAQLRARISRLCVKTQEKISSGASGLAGKCNCYAGRTLREMSADELQFYRDNGYFNDSTRAKALVALEGCGLKRP
jgi:hypothetical protein